MKVWRLIMELKRLDPSAEVFYVVEPFVFRAGESAETYTELESIDKVEQDPDGSVVLS